MEVLGIPLGKGRRHQLMIQETLKVPRITIHELFEDEFLEVLQGNTTKTWVTPYKRYLDDGLLSAKPAEAKIVLMNASRYTLIDGNLFRHGYTHSIFTCVSGDQCTRIMVELHEGICGSHIGGQALSLKVIRAGYYWSMVKDDCVRYVQHSEQCQKHVYWYHVPTEDLRSIYISHGLSTCGGETF
ncbi:uncharacterized protein [Phaseolus vulgaris]|uniref:uncharacterized protein n=1 Tax=Phaseolus vulgaris TaxID=3885 RepID=UPI0035C9B657